MKEKKHTQHAHTHTKIQRVLVDWVTGSSVKTQIGFEGMCEMRGGEREGGGRGGDPDGWQQEYIDNVITGRVTGGL